MSCDDFLANVRDEEEAIKAYTTLGEKLRVGRIWRTVVSIIDDEKRHLQWNISEAQKRCIPKKMQIRIKKSLPMITGVDLTQYGPFHEKQVASIPRENALILIERGLAEEMKKRAKSLKHRR